MKSKALLFTGIALLLIGILIKKMADLNTLGLILIISGVTCKTTYIIAKYRSGEYKPGIELLFLFIGLGLFFTGIYLKNTVEPTLNPVYFMVSGIVFKITFIFGFIRSVKRTAISKS